MMTIIIAMILIVIVIITTKNRKQPKNKFIKPKAVAKDCFLHFQKGKHLVWSV